MKFSATSASLIISLASLLLSSRAQEPSTLCLCSPRTYSFTLALSQSCKTDTLANSPGIWTTVCSTDSNFGADTEFTEMIPNVGESLVRRILSDQIPGDHNERVFSAATDDMVPVKIISLVFAEVLSDGSLVITNKDETLANVKLDDGAVVEFDSISKRLDLNVDINDQLSSVPGGVTMLLVGENSIGELVKTRMLWLYDNNCDAVPLAGGGALGWITVDASELASDKFCPTQSSASSKGTLFAKSGKVGNSANTTTPSSSTQSAKTGKIGKSVTTDVNMAFHGIFAKASKTSGGSHSLSKSGKANFVTEKTETLHNMSTNYDESVQSNLIESKSGKVVKDNSNSKSQKK